MRGECAKKESAVLKRLGPVPFWRGERKCLDALGEMYSRAMESASRRLAAAKLRARTCRQGGEFGIIESEGHTEDV